MDATGWDERYRSAELVWGVEPNRWVEQEVAALEPGIALDLGCGEGRNDVWLAGRGWQVQAVDFSAVALDKGRALEQRSPGRNKIDWVQADVTTFTADARFDLALLCYLQLAAPGRRAAVRTAANALAPGGTLLVIGHATRNLTEGTGGPQDASYLFSPDDVRTDLDGIGVSIERADEVLRPVAGAERPAIDVLVRARRPQ